MNIEQYCRLRGHEYMQVTHFCMFNECHYQKRRCCAECIKGKIHDHNDSEKLSHIEQFFKLKDQLNRNLRIIKQEHINYSKDCISKIQQKVNSIIKMMTEIIFQIQQYMKDQIQNLKNSQQKLLRYIKDSQGNDFQKLDDKMIQQYLEIDINSFIFNVDKQIQPLAQIEQKFQDFQYLIEQSNIKIALKQKKYIIGEIDQTSEYFYASQISNNLQYLCYGGEDKILKIYDIKQQKIIKNIDLHKQIYICQFTDDSSKLYVGLIDGYVYGYKMSDSFQQVLQIHQHNVLNILIKDQYLITCSRDHLIIMTDIKTQQKQLDLVGHTDYVMAIDYNDVDDTIISGSGDKSLKLWNCKNKNIIIDKQLAHKQEIRSLDRDGCLVHWKIDVILKDIIKIQQFLEQNKIYNFYSINQNSNIILLCQNNRLQKQNYQFCQS